MAKRQKVVNMLEDIEPVEDSILKSEDIPQEINHHDRIMQMFNEDELIEGRPNVDGLRRVAELELGELVFTDVRLENVIPLNNNIYRYIVKYTCIYEKDGRQKQFSEIADVSMDNTQREFYCHPTATASTRAEGRALRKALKLRKMITAEEADAPALEEVEAMNAAWKPDNNLASGADETFMGILCERTGIDLKKFIGCGKEKFTSVREISKDKIAEMHEQLSKLQNLDTEDYPAWAKGCLK